MKMQLCSFFMPLSGRIKSTPIILKRRNGNEEKENENDSGSSCSGSSAGIRVRRRTDEDGCSCRQAGRSEFIGVWAGSSKRTRRRTASSKWAGSSRAVRSTCRSRRSGSRAGGCAGFSLPQGFRGYEPSHHGFPDVCSGLGV